MLFIINKISPNKDEILLLSDKEKHNLQKISIHISESSQRHYERGLL